MKTPENENNDHAKQAPVASFKHLERTVKKKAPVPAVDDENQSFILQKQANFLSAQNNLITMRNMLQQAKHKLWDLEQRTVSLKASGASSASIEMQMKAGREALQSFKDLSKEVKRIELEIQMEYAPAEGVWG